MNQVRESFAKYFIEMMKYLSIQHKKDEMKTYRIYYVEGNSYDGIQLDRLRFRASNVYELWLKIYDYMMKNSKDYEIYLHGLYHRYLTELEYTDPNRNAIHNIIDDEINLWEYGDTLWWMEDDTEYI